MGFTSLKVAEHIAKIGYNQNSHKFKYVIEDCSEGYTNIEHKRGDFIDITYMSISRDKVVSAPGIMAVWSWLWKVKGVHLNTDTSIPGIVCVNLDQTPIQEVTEKKFEEPDEAILYAMEVLIDKGII